MKKFYAIVLGLVMVLSLATIASAEFKISGEIDVEFGYDLNAEEWGFDFSNDTEYNLKISNTWGDIAGDVTFWNAETFVANFIVVKEANVSYKLSDSFSIGAKFVGDEYKWYGNVTALDDQKFVIAADPADCDYYYGKFSFEGGSIALYSDLEQDDVDLFLTGSYAFDPFTVGGFYNGATEIFGAYLKYALTEELTLSGEIQSDDPELSVGLKAEYETDQFDVYARLRYETDAELLHKYKVYGEYMITETLKIYGDYEFHDSSEKDTGFTVGAELTLEGDATLTAELDMDDLEDGSADDSDTFTVTLALPF